MLVYSFLIIEVSYQTIWVFPHMPYIFSLYYKYLWKNSLCLEIKLTGISTIRVRTASTHNMHCMNLYMYQPLISTGLTICDMTWCPWNTTHILCFEQSRWIKPGIKYLCPMYFNHAIYSIYMWTSSSLYLKGISCGNNFPALSYHHDKNVLQLSPTEPPPFVNLYHGSLFPAHHV